MIEDKFVKFNKIVTINDHSFEVILMATQKLLWCMQETNKNLNLHTEFLKLNLTNSEKSPFGKDLILEWACLDNKGKDET